MLNMTRRITARSHRQPTSRFQGKPPALIAAALALLLALTVAPTPSASAAVVPGSQADLRVSVAGPSSANSGDAFTYTVTITNNSIPDADGATFTDTFSGGASNVTATCAATNGAACPASLSTSDSGVSGTIGAFPHLGSVVVTVSGNFTGGATVTNTATITPPSGVTDPDTTTNTSFVSTALGSTTNLIVTKSTSTTTITAGQPVDYTVVIRNDGPSGADRARISDQAQWTASFSSYNVSNFSCSTTGGANCPNFSDRSNLGSIDYAFTEQIPSFPSGSSITITYRTTFNSSSACGSTPNPYFRNTTNIYPPQGITDSDYSDNESSSTSSMAETSCPTAGLSVAKTADVSTTVPGGDIEYTVVVANSGPASADGALVRDESRWTANISGYNVSNFQCVPTGGAVCPTFTDRNGLSSLDYAFDARVVTFPAGSTITITYRTTTVAGTARCSTSSTPDFMNTASVYPPSGTTDPNFQDNNSSVTTPVAEAPCPATDVAVKKTVIPGTLVPGKSIGYQVMVTNDGPSAADGTQPRDYMTWNAAIGSYNVSGFSCTSTGGATCPTLTDKTALTGMDYAINAPITSFPSGSSVIISYTTTFNSSGASCQSTSSPYIRNTVEAYPPQGTNDPNFANNFSSIDTPVNCAEVSVNSTISPGSIQAGDPFALTITVTNSGPGTADAVQFSDPLNSNIDYVSATCTASAGAPTCGTVDFDPATMTVTSLIPSLAPGESVTFTISATGGVTAGTIPNTAAVSTTAASTYYDPNDASDSSRVSLQIFNTTSKITVLKRIEGLGSAGTSADLTFTGLLVCATQSKQNWSVTVPAGSTTASAAPLTIYDGEDCSVTEDTPATTPAGYTWAANPVISPAIIDGSQAQTDRTVTVTNTAAPVPVTTATVIVHKEVTGAPVGLTTTMTFGGQVTCTMNGGASSSYDWEATVPQGTSSANASPITVPADSDCAVTESAPPTAPAGYEWITPVITPATSGALAAGSSSDFTVNNRLNLLAADTGSIRITKEITGAPLGGLTGSFAFAAFCGTNTYEATLTITNTYSGAITISGISPGENCTIRETAKSAAPTGYTWAEPIVSAALVPVNANSVSDVTVTNPLSTMAAPAAGNGVREADSKTTLAFTGFDTRLPLLGGIALLLLGAGTITSIQLRHRRRKLG